MNARSRREARDGVAASQVDSADDHDRRSRSAGGLRIIELVELIGVDGGSGATGTSSSSNSGVATAAAELKQYQATPTQITITTPLKSAPPTGKTVVMLGTNDPSNAIIQHSVQELAGWSAGTTRLSRTTRPTPPRSVRQSTPR